MVINDHLSELSFRFPLENERFLLPGPAGQLEVMTTRSQRVSGSERVAVICHPHPLYKGTMDNKVVTIMAKAYDALGMATVRFNFRGVGKSSGVYGEAIGEYEDLEAIIQWVQSELPDYELWLAGFSFGSYIAARFANEHTQAVRYLVSIAPPVHHCDFLSLKNIACSWLVVQGDQDEVVSSDLVRQFTEQATPSIHLAVIPRAGHFFHGQLLELQHLLESELSQQ